MEEWTKDDKFDQWAEHKETEQPPKPSQIASPQRGKFSSHTFKRDKWVGEILRRSAGGSP